VQSEKGSRKALRLGKYIKGKPKSLLNNNILILFNGEFGLPYRKG